MDDLKTRRVGDVGLMDTLPDDVNVLVEKDGAVRRVPSDALGGAFYVTVTQTEDGNITADKSFDEIVKAYESGKALYCKINEGSEVLSCVAVHPDSQICTFASLNQPMCATVNYNSGEWRINYVQMARESDLPKGFSGSWNDLTDKPFYDNTEVIFPEQTVTDGDVYDITDQMKPLEVGKTYTVYVDGVEYQCTASAVNNGIYNGVRLNLENGMMIIYTLDTAEYKFPQVLGEFAVSIVLKEIAQLDEKYIPSTIARTADTVANPSAAAVGQAIVVKAVDENGKPTEWEAVDLPAEFSGSWNDLTDKPFYEQKAEVILPEQTVKDGDYITVADPVKPIEGGKTYRVLFAGEEYQVEAYSEGDTVALNFAAPSLSTVPNQISVLYMSDSYGRGPEYYIAFEGISGGHALSILYGEDTTVPLDGKYLPKATTVANAAGDTPTAAEFNALLTALRNAGYLAT